MKPLIDNSGKLFDCINQSKDKLDEYKDNHEQFCNLNPELKEHYYKYINHLYDDFKIYTKSIYYNSNDIKTKYEFYLIQLYDKKNNLQQGLIYLQNNKSGISLDPYKYDIRCNFKSNCEVHFNKKIIENVRTNFVNINNIITSIKKHLLRSSDY